jgi:hypothetical protein
MFRISVCICAFFLLACCVLPMAAQPSAQSADAILQPAVVTYYGCVNNTTGAIRIVSKATICKSTEHKISWNEVGPRGLQGPKGNKETKETRDPRDPEDPGTSGNFRGLLQPSRCRCRDTHIVHYYACRTNQYYCHYGDVLRFHVGDAVYRER